MFVLTVNDKETVIMSEHLKQVLEVLNKIGVRYQISELGRDEDRRKAD